MARPSDDEVAEALREMERAAGWELRDIRELGLTSAVETLRRALEPRVPMPSKEFAALIGRTPADLSGDRTPGLPEPAVSWPRPTRDRPDQVVRLWWLDTGEDFNEAKGGK